VEGYVFAEDALDRNDGVLVAVDTDAGGDLDA
jgi:hypothetical protein